MAIDPIDPTYFATTPAEHSAQQMQTLARRVGMLERASLNIARPDVKQMKGVSTHDDAEISGTGTPIPALTGPVASIDVGTDGAFIAGSSCARAVRIPP